MSKQIIRAVGSFVLLLSFPLVLAFSIPIRIAVANRSELHLTRAFLLFFGALAISFSSFLLRPTSLAKC